MRAIHKNVQPASEVRSVMTSRRQVDRLFLTVNECDYRTVFFVVVIEGEMENSIKPSTGSGAAAAWMGEWMLK